MIAQYSGCAPDRLAAARGPRRTAAGFSPEDGAQRPGRRRDRHARRRGHPADWIFPPPAAPRYGYRSRGRIPASTPRCAPPGDVVRAPYVPADELDREHAAREAAESRLADTKARLAEIENDRASIEESPSAQCDRTESTAFMRVRLARSGRLRRPPGRVMQRR